MRRLLVGLITLLVVVLLSGRSMAQSNVLSPDQRSVFAQMDPSLLGFWEGHGDGDGMKFDPKAIACMVNKCSILHSAHSTLSQLRDARNFQTCYAAHMARVRSGYTRLANPPPIYTLGCNVIAAQANSKDDRVFAAVNGRPRVQPATAKPRAIKHRVANVSIEERAFLLAQMTRPLADPSSSASASSPASSAPPAPKAQPPRVSSMPDDNPYKDDAPKAAPKPITQPKLATKPTVAPTAPQVARVDDNPYKGAPELGENLVLVSASPVRAVIYVKPGGQFYTVRSSFLAKKYEVDWKAVYTYEGNQYADFIGSCWHGNKVALDADRMKARSYDKAKLMGPVDPDFMNACDGEFNFALQAGRTIVLPIKGIATVQAAPSKEPDQPPAEQPKQAQVDESPPPAPTMDSIEVPLVTPTASMDSDAASSANAQPPPSDSPTINVTVNGKKPAAHPPVSLGRFGTWCQGKSGTRLLVAAFILL
ncbi:MAG: hypothetical protein PHC53_03920, partial [Patescibacteria group bacterium]|nr:hypothetical protein [Patescibacteria group bacterium]